MISILVGFLVVVALTMFNWIMSTQKTVKDVRYCMCAKYAEQITELKAKSKILEDALEFYKHSCKADPMYIKQKYWWLDEWVDVDDSIARQALREFKK